MEGVLEGLELVGRRAARRADLVPPRGAAESLVMAGSWKGSGHEVCGRQPRREDEGTHLCERLADAVQGLVRGTLEACAAALRSPFEARLWAARERHGGDGLELATVPEPDMQRDDLSALPGRRKMRRRSRFLSGQDAVASHQVGARHG